MAEDNNNQQNQQKNKGGGGGGGVSGIQYGGKLDPAQMRTGDSLGQLITDQLIVASTAVLATACMYGLTKVIRGAFKVSDKPAVQQNPGQINPGQLTGAMFNLKKSNPDQFQELMNKLQPMPVTKDVTPAE